MIYLNNFQNLSRSRTIFSYIVLIGILNEITWIIVIGLGFDILGAFLIISPWLYFQKWNYEKILDEVNSEKRITPEVIRKRNRQQKFMLIGFGLLILGFILQIMGNWSQNPPS